MIFCNTKKSALELQEHLKKSNIEAEVLIGGVDQKDRDKIIDDFRKQVTMILISTNVLARGIDVPEVDLVVNYDVPVIKDCGYFHADVANYLHRVGRTGRFGTDGLAVNLFQDETEDDILDTI
jgi:superfamily II DNA/RNA helicase